MATQKALVLHQYGKLPTLQDFQKPSPKAGQLLIQVEASTVNPSDRGRLSGGYKPVPLPAVMGLQGTGRVIKANGEGLQTLVGKRVSFLQNGSGAWGQYALTTPESSFIIDQDVPIQSAASGIINPLTAIGIVDIYNSTHHKKGIIHTAAASGLGRMLNKYCRTLGIPLLNIVRRKEHYQLLKSEGAKHVIVTEGDWENSYKEAIATHGFNVLFDALGGGPVTQTLIVNLNKNSIAHVYGYLEAKPLAITLGLQLAKGISITGYDMWSWYTSISEQKQKKIKQEYSHLLKTDLASNNFKTVTFANIVEAIELSVSKATEGKITLVPK